MDTNTKIIRDRISDRAVVIRAIDAARDSELETLACDGARKASHAITEEIHKAKRAMTLAKEIANNELDAEWSNFDSI
jgi:hypothetical protein